MTRACLSTLIATHDAPVSQSCLYRSVVICETSCVHHTYKSPMGCVFPIGRAISFLPAIDCRTAITFTGSSVCTPTKGIRAFKAVCRSTVALDMAVYVMNGREPGHTPQNKNSDHRCALLARGLTVSHRMGVGQGERITAAVLRSSLDTGASPHETRSRASS